jgi:hypothetical protein
MILLYGVKLIPYKYEFTMNSKKKGGMDDRTDCIPAWILTLRNTLHDAAGFRGAKSCHRVGIGSANRVINVTNVVNFGDIYTPVGIPCFGMMLVRICTFANGGLNAVDSQ